VPFSVPLSHLSPLVVCSKKIWTKDPGKGKRDSEEELLDVTFYHRGKIFFPIVKGFLE
jgi:hypothetical protein